MKCKKWIIFKYVWIGVHHAPQMQLVVARTVCCFAVVGYTYWPPGWPLLFAGRRSVPVSPFYYVFTAVNVSVVRFNSWILNCLLCRDLIRISRIMHNIFHANVILTTYRFSSVWIAEVQSLLKNNVLCPIPEFVLFSGPSRLPYETRQISPAAQHRPAPECSTLLFPKTQN